MARQAKGITLPIIYKADMGGLNQATRGLQGFGRVAAQVALAAGAALAGIAVGGIRMASNLETSFAKIQGLVGVTTDEIDVLRDAAKRLGPEFGASANEAAEALFFITSAGLRGNDAIEVLEASLKGAAIGLGEVNTIADLATSAMNAYGPEVLGAAESVDVLAEAVRLGKLEPAELAGAMGQLLPIASAMGIEFADVGAAMAAMSRTGTDASTAATQLRGIMSALLRPTAQAERALAGMGTSSAALRESIRERGLLVTLQDLTEQFDGNEAAIASVFGNVRALSGVLDLFGANAEGTMDILAEMTDGVGVLDEAFEIMEDTVGFKAARAFETLKGIMLEVGDALLPVVSDLLTDLAPIIEDLAQASAEWVATELVPFINNLRDNPRFQTFMEDLSNIIKDLAEPAMDVASAIAEIAAALAPVLTSALDEALPVVSNLSRTIGNLSRSLAILFPNLNSTSESVDGVNKSLADWIMNPIWTFIVNRVEMIARVSDDLRKTLEENEAKIREFWTNIGRVISTALDQPLESLRGTFSTIGQVFSNAFRTLFGITDSGVRDQERPFRSRGPALTAAATGLITNVLSAFQRVWPSISNWLSGAVAGLPGLVDRIRGAMSSAGSGVMSSLLNGLRAAWGAIINWLRGRANDIRNQFSGVNLRSIGQNIMNSLLGGMQANWSGVWKWVRARANQIAAEFKKALKIDSPSKVFFGFGENIMEGLIGGMEKLSPTVDATVSGIVPTVPTTTGSGAGGGVVYNINVTGGMMDPEGVAREVVRVLNNSQRRSGAGAGRLVA
jgi:TP901 family phage tail tape measure protein